MPPELSIVLPTHNESAVIERVIQDVADTAQRLVGAGRWEVIVVDDASTDATGELLDGLRVRMPGLTVLHLVDNVGHGPALRRGWESARGEWVGHLDSDDEIPPEALENLWRARSGGDLILGVRRGRSDTLARRLVTRTLRSVAGAAAGRPLDDANTPCKLVRNRTLDDALRRMPTDAFAPSVLLAVIAARRGETIVEVPVGTTPRLHGRSWLVPTTLARGCARSTIETIRVAWNTR